MIRADFSRPREWEQLKAAITEPQTEDEFTANVTFVDDPAYEGVTAPEVLALVPAGMTPVLAFLADAETLTHPERPILAINLYDWVEGLEDQGKGPQYGDTFRVIPAEMWSVENNLSISNMDWEEFAGSTDPDGIFRGFA